MKKVILIMSILFMFFFWSNHRHFAFAAGASENIINIPDNYWFPDNSYKNFQFFASGHNQTNPYAYVFIPSRATSDNNINWLSPLSAQLPAWIGVTFKQDMYFVNKVSITFASTDTRWRPTKFEFQGSNDGSTWNTILPVTDLDFSKGKTLSFSVPETDYKSYRWYFPVGAGPNNAVGATALQIFGYPKIPPPNYNLLASSVANHTVDLTWSPVTDAVSYTVYRNGVPVAKDVKTASFQDTGLKYGTSYNYQVSALKDTGFEFPLSDVLQVQTTATIPDYQLKIQSATNDSITLNWMKIPGAAFYRVFEDGTMIANNVTDTSFVHKGLSVSKDYRYQVMAVLAAGIEEPISNVVTGQTTNIDTTPPDRPEITSVTNGYESGTVRWKPNSEPDLDGYNVYVDGVKWNKFLLKNNYVDIKQLKNGTSYKIEVTAVDFSGNESVKSIAWTITPSAKAVPPVSFTWTLKDIVESMGNWFSSIWLILAFTIAIPLAFYIGNRVKGLFN